MLSFKKLIAFHQIRIIATNRSSGLVLLTDTELQAGNYPGALDAPFGV